MASHWQRQLEPERVSARRSRSVPVARASVTRTRAAARCSLGQPGIQLGPARDSAAGLSGLALPLGARSHSSLGGRAFPRKARASRRIRVAATPRAGPQFRVRSTQVQPDPTRNRHEPAWPVTPGHRASDSESLPRQARVAGAPGGTMVALHCGSPAAARCRHDKERRAGSVVPKFAGPNLNGAQKA